MTSEGKADKALREYLEAVDEYNKLIDEYFPVRPVIPGKPITVGKPITKDALAKLDKAETKIAETNKKWNSLLGL